MPVHLLIDGYNVLKRGGITALFGETDLDSARSYLFEYKKEKRVHITVVFDAPLGQSLTRQRASYKGVEVIYSKQGSRLIRCCWKPYAKSRPGWWW
jgi:predicted RNA-binding protein with PIN domain